MMVNKLPAKIIQIQTASIPAGPNNGHYVELIVLCADGSLWMQYRSNGTANVPTCDEEWYLLHGAASPKVVPAIRKKMKRYNTREFTGEQ